jgi:Transposase
MTHLPIDEFAAFVGFDWAEAKHDVCLQASGSQKREFSVLEHQPNTIDEWVSTLRTRFKEQPIAIWRELNKGPIVSALRKYDCLVLVPVHPLTRARYREAFTPSHAKDDPADAELQLELLLTHRDKLKPLTPQSPEMRALEQLVEYRRRLVGDKVRITNCLLRSSVDRIPAPRLPRPPAFETAATSSADVNGPMPACMTGNSIPRRSHRWVCNMVYLLERLAHSCALSRPVVTQLGNVTSMIETCWMTNTTSGHLEPRFSTRSSWLTRGGRDGLRCACCPPCSPWRRQAIREAPTTLAPPAGAVRCSPSDGGPQPAGQALRVSPPAAPRIGLGRLSSGIGSQLPRALGKASRRCRLRHWLWCPSGRPIQGPRTTRPARR